MQSRLFRIRLALFAVLLGAGSAPAAGGGAVNWIDDPEVAARESTRTGKPILVQVTADWCGYCHKMFRETYGDPDVADAANSDFVCLRVDADKHKKLVAQFDVKALPTTVILTPDLRVATKLTGYQTTSRLGTVLRESRKLTRQTPGKSRIAAEPANTQQQRQPATGTVARYAPSAAARTAAPVPATNPFEDLDSPQPARTAPPTGTARESIRAISRSRLLPAAFDKMCLVTLFDERRVETGSLDHTSTYRGRTVYFSSSAAKARFDAQPDRYWPVLDGHCAVSYLDNSRQVPGNPVFGAVFRERMWFFESADQMETFIVNPREYLPQSRTPQI